MWWRPSHDNPISSKVCKHHQYTCTLLSFLLWRHWTTWFPSLRQRHIFPAVGNTNWLFLACITLPLHQFFGQLWGQILKKRPSGRCLATLFSIILITCCVCRSCVITSAVLHLLQFPLRSPLHIIFPLLASNFISLCFQSVFNYFSFS